ncbi:MAG: hypothetical protein CBC24_02195 [Candidatus Pelagibacter sp. TMED64]|nr:MAG: hypothetical protein CBC24_02195 [Candidatus Pelagibacter sp. TMED64]|tara:strand:+ start:60 stop:317 length:258 start_codon:yes stop_codon:yes gene_type:complete
MDIFVVLGAGYLATWVMLFYRTYFICVRMIQIESPNSIILKYRMLHAIFFVLALGIITLPLIKVAFSDEIRKRFCIGYVNAILEK